MTFFILQRQLHCLLLYHDCLDEAVDMFFSNSECLGLYVPIICHTISTAAHVNLDCVACQEGSMYMTLEIHRAVCVAQALKANIA